MNYISFPGIGIDWFALRRVAFNVLGRDIYMYGLIICLGIVLAVVYICYRGRFEGISTDDVIDYALVTVPLAIVGARTYFVLTSLDSFHSFYDAIAIWEGGIAIYGAIIGGFIAIVIVSCFKKVKLWKMLDATAPGVLLGQIIGRWGNFFNAEAYGDISKLQLFGWTIETPSFAESFPMRMLISKVSPDILGGSLNGVVIAHPTFLYESVWNLIGFILINIVYKKKKFDGEILLLYLGWYGFGRFFIEGFRTDSLYIGNIRISQLVGLVCAIVCSCLLIYMRKRAAAMVTGVEDYTPVFAGGKEAEKEANSEKESDEMTADAENGDSDKSLSEADVNTTEEEKTDKGE